jgi:hypothetical protein
MFLDYWYGTIKNCYSESWAIGDDTVGGLVGFNAGMVAYCYSSGFVSGIVSVGGLVGFTWYHALSDACVVGSFWDVQTSANMRSAGGTRLWTAKMHVASTYLDAGWDFVDETDNGTEDLWWIVEGQDYPRLSWQRPE